MSAAATCFGGAFGDDAAAVGPGVGTDLENPVGGLQDIEIVLDNDHAVAAIDERLEDGEEAFDVVAMKPGGGLVEEEERAGGGASSGAEIPAVGRIWRA